MEQVVQARDWVIDRTAFVVDFESFHRGVRTHTDLICRAARSVHRGESSPSSFVVFSQNMAARIVQRVEEFEAALTIAQDSIAQNQPKLPCTGADTLAVRDAALSVLSAEPCGATDKAQRLSCTMAAGRLNIAVSKFGQILQRAADQARVVLMLPVDDEESSEVVDVVPATTSEDAGSQHDSKLGFKLEGCAHPSADVPATFGYGPLTGSAAALMKAISGQNNPRKIDLIQKHKNEAIFVRRHSARNFEVYFRSRAAFDSARRKLQ